MMLERSVLCNQGSPSLIRPWVHAVCLSTDGPRKPGRTQRLKHHGALYCVLSLLDGRGRRYSKTAGMSLDFLSQCPCCGQQSSGTRGTQKPSNQLDQLGQFSLALALSVKQTNENSLASESYVWGEEGNTSCGGGVQCPFCALPASVIWQDCVAPKQSHLRTQRSTRTAARHPLPQT